MTSVHSVVKKFCRGFLHDLGNAEVPGLGRGGVREHFGLRQGRLHHVGAKDVLHVQHVRQGFHIRGVELVELFYIGKDGRKLLGVLTRFFIGHIETRQTSHVSNVFFGKGHGEGLWVRNEATVCQKRGVISTQ